MFGKKKELVETEASKELTKLLDETIDLARLLSAKVGSYYYVVNLNDSPSQQLYDAYKYIQRLIKNGYVFEYTLDDVYFQVIKKDSVIQYYIDGLSNGVTKLNEATVEIYKVMDDGTLVLNLHKENGSVYYEYTEKYKAGSWWKITNKTPMKYELTDSQKETLLKCKMLLKSYGVIS